MVRVQVISVKKTLVIMEESFRVATGFETKVCFMVRFPTHNSVGRYSQRVVAYHQYLSTHSRFSFDSSQEVCRFRHKLNMQHSRMR